MSILTTLLIALIAVFHLYILYFEMFAWETKGRKVFSQFPKELFPQTKVMAANQGLYNGFLAAGLLWGLWLGSEGFGVKVFFLLCIWVAGIYGAATAARKILYVQTVPATIGLVLLFLARAG